MIAYLYLLQLFLHFTVFEVGSLVEVEEEHEEDDRVDEQHSCHQLRVSTVKNEDLGRVDEHKRELQLWYKIQWNLIHLFMSMG